MSNDLCNDIIIEILSWLPVDSLLRFKSVSKSWLSLITTRRFVKLHIDHNQHSLTAATQIQHDPTNIMIFMSNTHYSIKSMDEISVSSSSSSSVIEKLEMVYSSDFLPEHDDTVEIIGSCNGLICLGAGTLKNRTNWIWNPSTKEFKLLPSHGVNDYNRITNPIKIIKYGFGYDHVIDDYKVIASIQVFGSTKELPNNDDMFNKEEDFYELELKVYTLGTNTWKAIQGKQPYDSSTCFPLTTWTHVNGAFHRIDLLPLSKLRILSFDIVDEVYRQVPEPECFNGSYAWEMTVLKGCLCLCSRHRRQEFADDQSMVVWMMKDYGVKESWTKLFDVTNNVIDFYRLKPVWFCQNGKIVMESTSELGIYDPKHGDGVKWLKSTRSNVRDELRFVTTIYAGSLVSLKSQE